MMARQPMSLLLAVAFAASCGGGSSSGVDGGDGDADPSSANDATTRAGEDGNGGEGAVVGVLLFGGDSGEGLLGDTWSWDGDSWAGELISSQPEPRRDHALAFDSTRDRAVLFGGFDGSDHLRDTWEWDGERWEDADDSPPSDLEGRSGHALAYDDSRGRVVLFGGTSGDTLFGDTWLWDGASWEPASLDNDLPARAEHAMAYDAAAGELVVFGGDDGELLADTWILGEDGWIDVSPPASESPPARADHALAYDPDRERVVLFGGTGGTGPLDDTWEWDGSAKAWTEIEVDAPPTARSEHGLVYDPVHQRVILFGGVDEDGEPRSETLAWDGSAWAALSGDDANGPARSGHALTRAPRP